MVRLSHCIQMRVCMCVCVAMKMWCENVCIPCKWITGGLCDIGINDGRSRHPINPFLNIHREHQAYFECIDRMREGCLVLGLTHSSFMFLLLMVLLLLLLPGNRKKSNENILIQVGTHSDWLTWSNSINIWHDKYILSLRRIVLSSSSTWCAMLHIVAVIIIGIIHLIHCERIPRPIQNYATYAQSHIFNAI